MIFGEKSIHVGYERILSKKQSFSVNIGRAYFPAPILTIIDSSIGVQINLEKEYKDKGFSFAVDYRFYLQKENKFSAPRGVYLGPYYSFSHFERDNTWTLETKTATGKMSTHMNVNIHMMGIQMGYQFVLWKRLALDCILLGPGLTYYSFKTSIQTDMSGNYDEELFKRLYAGLINRFPGYAYVLDQGEFESSGTANTTSMGFRYVIHVGYRF